MSLPFAPVACEVTDGFAQGVLSGDLWLRLSDPAFQLSKDLETVFMKTDFRFSVTAVFEVALNAIKLVDRVQRDIRRPRFAFGCISCASTNL